MGAVSPLPKELSGAPRSLRKPRRSLVPSAAAEPPRGRGRGEGAVAAALPCPITLCAGTGHGPEAGLVVMMVAVNFRISQRIPELENGCDTPRPPDCASSLPLGIGARRPCPSLSSHCPGLHGLQGPRPRRLLPPAPRPPAQPRRIHQRLAADWAVLCRAAPH